MEEEEDFLAPLRVSRPEQPALSPRAQELRAQGTIARVNMALASFGDVQPGTEAEMRRLAERQNIPLAAARAAGVDNLRRTNAMDTVANSPTVRRAFGDENRARIMADDTDQLSALDNVFNAFRTAAAPFVPGVTMLPEVVSFAQSIPRETLQAGRNVSRTQPFATAAGAIVPGAPLLPYVERAVSGAVLGGARARVQAELGDRIFFDDLTRRSAPTDVRTREEIALLTSEFERTQRAREEFGVAAWVGETVGYTGAQLAIGLLEAPPGVAAGAVGGGLIGGAITRRPEGVVTGGRIGGGLGLAASQSFFNFRQEAGLAFLEYQNMRLADGTRIDRETARGAAFVTGGINAVLETGADLLLTRLAIPGVDRLLNKPAKEVVDELLQTPAGQDALRQVASRAAQAATVEGFTELLQEIVNVATGQTALASAEGVAALPAVGFGLSEALRQESLARAGQAGLEGVIGGAGVTVVTSPATIPLENYFRERDLRAQRQRAQTATGRIELVERAVETAGRTRLVDRDRGELARFVNEATEESPVSTIYVSLADAAQLAQEQNTTVEDIVRRMGGTAETIAAAEASGFALEIPIGDFVASVTKTDLASAAVQIIKTNPLLYTRRELEVLATEGQEQAIAVAERLAAAAQNDVELQAGVLDVQAELERAIEPVRAQLAAAIEPVVGEAGAAQQLGRSAAIPYAKIAAEGYGVIAQVLGITPREAMARYPLRIGEMQVGPNLGQPIEEGAPVEGGPIVRAVTREIPVLPEFGTPEWTAMVQAAQDKQARGEALTTNERALINMGREDAAELARILDRIRNGQELTSASQRFLRERGYDPVTGQRVQDETLGPEETLGQEAKSFSEAFSFSDEQVLEWYAESVTATIEPGSIGAQDLAVLNAVLKYKAKPEHKQRLARTEFVASAGSRLNGLGPFYLTAISFYRGFTERPTAAARAQTKTEQATARSLFRSMFLATRGFILTNPDLNQPIVFAGATPAHSRVYQTFLRRAPIAGWKVYETTQTTEVFRADRSVEFVRTETYFVLAPESLDLSAFTDTTVERSNYYGRTTRTTQTGYKQLAGPGRPAPGLAGRPDGVVPEPAPAVAEGAETLGAGPEGGRRGQYNIAQQRIELSPNSDFSTFLHELGHHFLEVNNKIALDLLDRQKRNEILTTRQQQHLDDMRLLLNEAIKRSGIEPGEGLPENVVFQARQEGYLGQDPIEAQEWLRAKAKGLDMSPEGRMKRARAMGYDTDTVLYHGTSGDVKAFGRDTYLASDRRYSEDWIEGAQDGQIKEVYIKGRKYSADEEETQLVFSDIQILTQEEQQARRRLLRNIENEEYDYVYSPINGGETLVFSPSNIRSIHAAFDPDFADSPNLLAQQEGYLGQDPIEAQEFLRAKAKGLDMSLEGRMERARAMGFDVDQVWYRGSKSDYPAFDMSKVGQGAGGGGWTFNGVEDWRVRNQAVPIVRAALTRRGFSRAYVNLEINNAVRALQRQFAEGKRPYLDAYTPEERAALEAMFSNPQYGERAIFADASPQAAASYVTSNQKPSGRAVRGANLKPLYARGDFAIVDMRGRSYGSEVAQHLEQARSEGKSGVIFQNLRDQGSMRKPSTQIAVFDPKDFRSIHAAFDPDFADSPNLLAQEGQDGAPPAAPEGEGPRPEQDVIEWFNSLSFEQRRPIHEAFARMAETYFATGEAPTPRLKSLFEQFKEFMLKVYNDIQSFLGAPLSDEVRQAMDRFFIARTNVQRAEEGLGFTPAFATKPAFMSQQEWEGYQELTAQATREANGDLSARLMRDMQWLSGAKSREMRRLQRQHAAERRAIREEVTAEVADKPVNRARRFIARGIGQDGQVIPGPHKLSKAALQAQFPEVDLRALGFGQYGLVAEQGLDPDTVASMLGYQNGEALLNDLLIAPKQADEIKTETDRRMLERYGETTSREALERAANEAVHSQLRGRAIHAQHMALAKAVGSRALLRENAKAAAKIIVGRQPASKLSPKQAMAAERLAARRLMTALKANDLTAAATASRDQVLAFEITAETFRAQKAYQDALRLFRRVNTGKKENVAKNRNYDLVQAARAILSVYGAGTKVDAPMAYIKDIKKYDPALFASLEPLIDDAIGAQKPLKDLSVRELEGLRDVIDQLYTLSREEMKLEIANRQIELQDAVDSLTQRLQDIGAPPPVPPSRAATEGEKRARELQGLGNWLRRVESWARAVDGGVGPFTRLIWRPVSQAADAYRNARNDYIERFRALFTGIEGSLRTGRQIEAPELGYTFIGGKAELLHAILHTGNESNKRKLLLGMGWGRLMPDGETVDDSKWRSFMDRMHRDGVITQADYDFAQSVWDLLEEIKPLAQKAHRAVFGRFFSEITAQTVSTPFGDYRGGYVPAIYDPMRSQDAAQRRQQEDAIEANDSQMFPTPASGFTKSRADYSAPMLLDLKLLTTHIDKVLMFSYLAAPVRGVLRILKQKEFSNALAAYDPTAQTDMLLPWLQRSARQIVETPTTGQGGKMIDAGFRYIRRNSGMGLMMANLVNVLQQVTGFSLAAVMVKPHRLASALVRYTLNPMGTTDAVRAASAMMRERGDNQAAALFGEVTAIIDPKDKIKQLHNWFARHAYFMQVGLQNVMDVIVWQGAYSQAIAEGETHAEAVARGDSAVRLTQTSSLPEDIARAEGGNAGLRVFTHMYNYFNMWGNTLSTEYQIAVRDMGLRKGAGRLVFLYIAGFAIPALIGQLIADVMRGQLPEDDEDDGYLDEWLQYFFGVQAKTALAFAPIVGQVGVATMNVFNDKPYDDRIGGAPSISIVESAVRAPNSVYKAIAEEGDKSRAAKDFLTLLTLATNIPFTVLSRPIGYAIDVAEGDVEPTDELDYARGLVTGSASEASKQ